MKSFGGSEKSRTFASANEETPSGTGENGQGRDIPGGTEKSVL